MCAKWHVTKLQVCHLFWKSFTPSYQTAELVYQPLIKCQSRDAQCNFSLHNIIIIVFALSIDSHQSAEHCCTLSFIAAAYGKSGQDHSARISLNIQGCYNLSVSTTIYDLVR